jgi:hypothetical protein
MFWAMTLAQFTAQPIGACDPGATRANRAHDVCANRPHTSDGKTQLAVLTTDVGDGVAW